MNTKNQAVDYDQIAEKYNQRYHENPLAGVEQALIRLARASKATSILEVGCGTGRWLAGINTQLPAVRTYGLDYSRGMLSQAQKRITPLGLVRGKGGQLPFRAKSFDLVFCVNALHHLDDPQAFIAQARQLLAPGGVLAIIGQVPQDRRNRWFIYDYFHGVYTQDLQRFPSWGAVMDWIVGAGFRQIHWEPAEQISDNKLGRTVLDDPFLQKHAVSQLALLSDEAYEAGIAKIKTDLQQAEKRGETCVFKAELRLDIMTASAPKDD